MARLLLLGLLALLLTLSSVVAQQPDSITIVLSADPGTLNPLRAGNRAINQIIWTPLLNVDPTSGALGPGLVEAWEISDDGLTYTFSLGDDFTWSDGTPITANDVAYTMAAISSDAVNSPARGSLPPQAYESLQVLNDQQFSITLPQPNCTMLARVNAITLLPSHALSPDFSEVADLNYVPAISSGPYQVIEYIPGETIQLAANPAYKPDPPAIPTMTIQVASDAATAVQALADGQADILRLTPAELGAVGAPPNARIRSSADTGVIYLALNTADPANPQPGYDAQRNPIDQGVHPILGDARVRQTLARFNAEWTEAELRDRGWLPTGMLHPQTAGWAVDPNVASGPSDEQEAGQLLDEAGWVDEDGDGVRECHDCQYAEEGAPLAFDLEHDNVRPEMAVIAESMQQYLASLGMQVTLVANEVASGALSPILNQDFDAAIIAFGSFPNDPGFAYDSLTHSFFDVPGRGFNLVSYRSPELDSVLDQARTLPGCDPAERAALYRQAQAILYEDVPYIPIGIFAESYVVSNRVQGFDPAPGQPFWNSADWTLIGAAAELPGETSADASPDTSPDTSAETSADTSGTSGTSADATVEATVESAIEAGADSPAQATLQSPTPAPAPPSATTATPGVAAETCTVTANTNANLRAGPGTTFDIAGSVTAGQAFTATGQAEGADGATWLQGDTESVFGFFIRSDLVEGEELCADNLPVVLS